MWDQSLIFLLIQLPSWAPFVACLSPRELAAGHPLTFTSPVLSIDAQIANSAESGSALASGLTPMEEEALYRDIDQLDPENM